MRNNKDKKPDYTKSFELMVKCSTYEQYLILFDLSGLDENIRYTEEEFLMVRRFWDTYGSYF